MKGWRWTQALLAIAMIAGFSARTARAQGGTGLRTEYYIFDPSLGAKPNRAKVFTPANLRLVTLSDEAYYYADGVVSPARGLPPEYYAIRWSGQISMLGTDDYTFLVDADDGFRLWISPVPIDPQADKPIVDRWNNNDNNQQYRSTSLHLEAGTKYYLLFEMFNNTDLSHANIVVSSPTQTLLPFFDYMFFPTIPADRTPPEKTSDLSVVSSTDRTVTLQWTAPSDDAGPAAFYDLRYAFSPIDASNFDQATPAIFTPPPAVPGASQTFTVSGLVPLQPYYFAARTGDAAGNLSEVSNSPTGATQPIVLPEEPEHGLLREVYFNLPGLPETSIDVMRSLNLYPGGPDQIGYVSSFQTPSDVADLYGERVRGYLTAPQTGDYAFWISADDCGQLFLSSDEDPSHAEEIASVNDWTLENEWTKFATQKSAPVHLEAGKRYYIEALHGQIAGGSHLAVRWQLPDKKIEAPILSSRLTPFAYPRALGRITGVVSDQNDRPLTGVRVLVAQGELEFGGHTDENGYFTTPAPVGLNTVTVYPRNSAYAASISQAIPALLNQISSVTFSSKLDSTVSRISSITGKWLKTEDGITSLSPRLLAEDGKGSLFLYRKLTAENPIPLWVGMKAVSGEAR